MKIQTEMMGNVAILTLSGDIDSRSNQHVDQAIREVTSAGIYKVVMDVAGMRFMGNQLISKLVSNLKELRAGGGDIKLVNPQRAVAQYLKQNRLFEIFDIFSSRIEAVRSFASPEDADSKANAEPVIQSSDKTGSTVTAMPSATAQLNKNHFETGEVLYANSCMLATLIRMLESKNIISPEEANELIEFGALSVPSDES